MENKNIDNLFQEKLTNLEATPNKKVWQEIEQKLTKKKRRILPFWWFSSVAALFLIGFFLFPFSENKKNNFDNNIIITDTPNTKTPKNNILLDTFSTKKPTKTLIANDKIKNKKTFKKNKNVGKKPVFIANKNVAFQQKKEKQKELERENIKTTESKNTIVKNNSLKSTLEKDTVPKKNFLKAVKKSKKNLITVVKEDLEKEKNTDKKKEKLWSVNPVFAVLQSNSFTNTSSISNNLSNTTEGKNSISYGVQFGYKINEKWSIQSGIHQQKNSYQNSNIIATSTSINNNTNIAFSRDNSFDFINNSATGNTADFSLTNSTVSVGNLLQEFGYIEVPLEIKYSLFNTQKFNTQLVTGFSTLFLNNNSIYLNTSFFNEIGKAQNLNSVNFSGNFGVDFNYLLNKNWSLNINPMFKAQLNTFSENANGFAPFNIGIYSGIKYNF